jgi:hypothetical protein
VNHPFQIRISILGLQHTNAAQVLSDFIQKIQKKHPVEITEEIYTNCAHTQAEAILAIPFSERETVRIDFNIFSADFDTLHPDERTAYFKMESV